MINRHGSLVIPSPASPLSILPHGICNSYHVINTSTVPDITTTEEVGDVEYLVLCLCHK